MPTAVRPDVLCDTSIAVPLVVADHDHHRAVAERLGDRRLGLAGHAAFETFSVLTRLPPPARRSPATVVRLLVSAFPASCFLPETAAQDLLARLPSLGIAGGGVYDALVGAAAAAHRVPLATRDGRAAAIYRALDVDLELVS